MIAVTAASGKLGNLVLERLLKVVPASEIVAIARSPEKLAQFQARGVKVRRGDYSALGTLGPSLAGVKRLLLISGMDLGQRVAQHRAVIEAAEAAGVELIVYTSLLRADVSALPIAEEHRATEKLLRASKVPSVLLRNGWYIENYTERLAMNSRPRRLLRRGARRADRRRSPRRFRRRGRHGPHDRGTCRRNLRTRRRPALHDDRPREGGVGMGGTDDFLQRPSGRRVPNGAGEGRRPERVRRHRRWNRLGHCPRRPQQREPRPAHSDRPRHHDAARGPCEYYEAASELGGVTSWPT